MPTTRKTYTQAFKRDAVRLAQERANLSQTARDLGLCASVLQRWKRCLEATPQRPFPGNGNPKDLDLARLERENARLREENEILKAAVGIFTARPH